jgi:Mlc titration factor MtfA (ptsG expression regulator)
MKKIFLVFAVSLISSWTFAQKYYGEKISADGAVAVSQLPTLMKGKEKIEIKLTGKIESVCQKKRLLDAVGLG